MATRSRYQPHDGQTVCGVFALPQCGQRLRGGALSCHALALRLRVFDFEVFFFGTAIVRSPLSPSTGSSTDLRVLSSSWAGRIRRSGRITLSDSGGDVTTAVEQSPGVLMHDLDHHHLDQIGMPKAVRTRTGVAFRVLIPIFPIGYLGSSGHHASSRIDR
jgi:hypothetical protein